MVKPLWFTEIIVTFVTSIVCPHAELISRQLQKMVTSGVLQSYMAMDTQMLEVDLRRTFLLVTLCLSRVPVVEKLLLLCILAYYCLWGWGENCNSVLSGLDFTQKFSQQFVFLVLVWCPFCLQSTCSSCS